MSENFQAGLLMLLADGLADADLNVSLAWARSPEGAPVHGKTDVVLYNAPGGEREVTHSGMSGEEMRRVQVSMFSMDPQDLANVAEQAHAILDGFSGTLAGGVKVFGIIPGMQNIDSFDNDEKVFQTIFDVQVRFESAV